MSFGYGVGDFLAVVKLAKAIKVRFVSAPDQFRHISEASKTLCNVLRDIKDIYEQAELDTQQEKRLDEISRSCRSGLNELLGKLDEYQELDHRTNSLGGTCRRVWKRLKWDQAEMDEICQRIQSNVQIFNLFSTSLTSQVAFTTKELVHRVNNTMEEKAQHELLEWLTTVNYASQQGEYLDRRQEGTGKWLLGTDKFQQWINTDNKNIICTGIPGAGKTILTAIIIEHLEEKCKRDRNCGLAYIYCNFRRHHEQRVDDILASLIKQLCQRMPSLPEDIKSLFAQHKKQQTRPKLDELSKSLFVVLGYFSRTFIVVDALDEYSSSNEPLRRLLSELFSLQNNRTVSIFATSRHSPIIQSVFDGCLQQVISAAAEDVEAYLRGHMSDLLESVSLNADLQEEIVQTIKKTVDGMFLLAHLHLSSLAGKFSPKAVRKTLENLPSGTDAYNIAYEEAMERINGKTAGEKDLANQILAWVTCSRTPLTIRELQHGLAVEIEETEFDRENLPDMQYMEAACAGLVAVDTKGGIRVVHHTAQEYFKRTQTKWFPRAHYDMARACMVYLLQLALAEPGLVRGLLHDEKTWAWARTLATRGKNEEVFERLVQMPETVTKAHLAAYLGSESALRGLIEAGYPYNALDATNRSPLFWAAENGQEGATRFMIEQGLDLNEKDQWGFTPLALAAEKGHFEVVSLLLNNGASAHLKNHDGQTPLILACKGPYGPYSDHDRNARRKMEENTLYSQLRVVELLLEANCDPNDKEMSHGWTALHLAAHQGRAEVVELLLAKGVNPLSKDNSGQTPLFDAVRCGDVTVVQSMLDYGFDPNDMNDVGATPVLLASFRKNLKVVRVLLDNGAYHGADPNLTEQNHGQLPLVCAAWRGLASMVEALLSRGVDPDSQDRDGWTALLCAISGPLNFKKTRDKALLELTLEPGSNPKSHVSHIKSSLAATTGRDYEGVVKLLLQYKANPDTVNVNRRGWSPLMAAAARGRGNTVRLLLDTGNVNPKRQDEYGHDAAHYARKYGHDQIALLLSSPIMETNVAIKESVCTADQPENATLIASRAT
ncbi:hypothetical protein ASPTUDRAFT_130991 [Aspergillus tubingensis CBS 134.48]|uniref:Uncharacterized protein n=1 Tax=Aspergillus tubingensis (strain CBS 134.48) TaxID=767770 RepID=A0A1L9MR49_ASPTC|nr:hypothetical protein ASPTUDRAFT_130991 [Aspergillus tubingensis CBS 134.48]